MTANRRVAILAGLAGASLLVYWLMFVQPANLFELYGQPRLDVTYLFDRRPWAQLRLMLGFGLLAGLYGLSWAVARRAAGRLAWLAMLGGGLAFGGVLLALYPFDAADIFDNIMHGRILGIYGADPFQVVAEQFPGDPILPYVAWVDAPSAYGPGWESLAAGTARLAGNSIIASVIAFKLLPGLFLAGSIAVVAAILRRAAPEQAMASTLLLAWNPVVLYETLGNGHNDMPMVFWILLAGWLVMKRRYTWASLALVIGTLFKFIPMLLLPAVVCIAWHHLGSPRPRWRFVLLTGAGCALVLVLAYAPFWRGTQVLSIDRRTHLLSGSLPAVAVQVLQPRLGPEQADTLISGIAAAATIAWALWQARLAARRPDWSGFTEAAFSTLMFYLLVTCLWFQQWYTLWPLGLAPLLSNRQRGWALLFGFAALSKQFLLAPILWEHPPPAQPWLEIRLTAGALGLPWLYGLSIVFRPISAASSGSTHSGARTLHNRC